VRVAEAALEEARRWHPEDASVLRGLRVQRIELAGEAASSS
jgi:hypothetical protein